MRQRGFKKRFDCLIRESQNILIAGHINPDIDAFASCLSLDYYLGKNFPQKKWSLLVSTPSPSWWAEFKTERNAPVFFDHQDLSFQPDLVIFLDGGRLERFFLRGVPNLKGVKTICIDHHQESSYSFDLVFSDPKASATSQLIAEIFFLQEKSLPKQLAQILLIGILDDSGSLKYVTVENARVLSTVRSLMEKGKVGLEELVNKLESFSKKEFEVIKILVDNTGFVDSLKLPPLTYSFLPTTALDKFDWGTVRDAYHQYLHFFVRKIKGYPWGFVVIPRGPGVFGVSFRSSKEGPDVGKLAKKFFNGGGHRGAAGGRIEKQKVDSKKICQEIIEILT